MKYFTWLVFFLPNYLFAQAIDNFLSYKYISTDKYLRINYENDFFSSTDIYYTQGIEIDLVSPGLINNPLNKLLLHLQADREVYGLGIQHNGYTPTSLGSNSILYGDRPFAASLFLTSFISFIDADRGQRLTSSISTGVVGQAAGGMEMQTSIHRWLHDITPHGWPNQVHNDAILNYQVDFEKKLVGISNYFLTDAYGMARAGTLSDKAGTGITMMAGYFNSPYEKAKVKSRSFSIYAYEHAEINLVGYDATLQGGIFNHTSPYVIPASQVSRITFLNRFGFVVTYRRLYLEYFQSLLSREFTTGNYHVWGGIQLAFGL